MLFSSPIFIFAFLPFTIIVYYFFIKRKNMNSNIFLLFMSLVFYAWGEPFFVVLMLISIFVNWYFGILIDKYVDIKNISRRLLVFAIIFNVGMLYIFKYLTFTLELTNNLLKTDFNVPLIHLPIGISFFTFQGMSYVIDVYRKNGKVQKSPLKVGLYIALFPQLIAGPIIRYEYIAKQLDVRNESYSNFEDGIMRFIMGLGKKILIANTISQISDYTFNSVGLGFVDNPTISWLSAWLGALAYTLQIYYDFSGYSDMAIGLGKMFGFVFPENFNYPYMSKSIKEFWKRWHISLGSWFKDYVYLPLGGRRSTSKARVIRNLFVVWLLTGIWHGANFTFVVWGLWYFVVIYFERCLSCSNRIVKNQFYTLIVVIVGWVIFRSDNLSVAIEYLKIMFRFNPVVAVDDIALNFISKYYIIWICGIVGCTPFFNSVKKHLSKCTLGSILLYLYYMFVFLLSLIYCINSSYTPFIYFAF